MEGLQHEKIFGLPAWAALLTLGAAGFIGYLIFFKNQGASSSSNQGTTNQGTTGYSQQALAVMQNPDESATMAAQNYELSVLSQQFSDFGTQLGQVGDSVNSGFSSVGTSLNGINGQLTGLSGQVSGVSGQVQTSAAANQTYYQSLLASLQSYANQLSQQAQAGQAADVGLAQGLQADIIQMFYAIPNRYTTYLSPGVLPTTGPNFGG